LFVDNYKNDSLSPLRSPLIFPSHKDLPPAYFQVCGADPLRDEGLIYEMVLREDCGIKTKLDIFPGLPHGFWTWWPSAKFGVDLQEKSVAGLKWLLEQSK
jgi:acetyl esterase/lipase